MNYKFKKSLQSSVFSFRCPRSGLGFTLMELMVVVSLILILLGVGMTNYITQIKRSRDARRKSDLEQIRSALEMYRADEGEYPLSGQGWHGSAHSNWVNFEAELEPGYMSEVPEDLLNTATNYPGPCNSSDLYRYNYKAIDSGQRYYLTAMLEKSDSNNSPCDELPDWSSEGCSSGNTNYDYCYGTQNP